MLIGPLTQAYELSVLTGTQVLLLVVSETGLVYTFTTPKLQPLVTKPEGKNLIQVSKRSFNRRVALVNIVPSRLALMRQSLRLATRTVLMLNRLSTLPKT